MHLIDLTCPNCNGSLELDRDKEFGFCMYCGHKIYLASDMARKDKKILDNMSKLLDAAAASNDDDELLRTANRILEMDSSHADAWYWKGYVALTKYDLSGGFACWSNYVDNTTVDDLKDAVRPMAETIARSYFMYEEEEYIKKSDTDQILGLSASIDEKLFNVMPEEYYFPHEVLKNMGDCIIDSEDVDDILNGCIKIDTLFFDSFAIYPFVDLLYYSSSSLAALLQTAKLNNGRKNFSLYDTSSVNKEYGRLIVEIEFFETMSQRAKPVFDSLSDEDYMKVTDYWMENDAEQFYYMLYDIHELSMDMRSGLFGNKKRKNRDQKITEFFDLYLEPLS